MKHRTDLITASRVDLVLILLPAITHEEAAQSLSDSGVPADIAARVLEQPAARRMVPPTAAITWAKPELP